ncbi:9-divinyl ether synthase-like [Glycine max]|uniref:Hydroperoxide lyase n=1 Tax=Glycine max TaxID=3847 RepID=M4WFN0_SOYBN|nr:9-divinyl ether synthase-like [Glycine max]AGI15963.1 hydroperoxide lyase [Glycine max]|eukprot:NP_001304496.1 9-divinyl ether synthase-like [Glycine max]
MASSDSKLPLKPIPGSYGLPFFGPMSDRHDYFYNQGRDKFFAERIKKYNSTVIRTNMPPGPFISSNPRVIALLDGVSFPTLFDNSKVDKRDVLDGTFMPSTSFTGGYRACAFQDTTEPSHALLKRFYLNFLASKHETFLPLFRNNLSDHFSDLEDKLAGKPDKASFNSSVGSATFNFLFRLLSDKDPSETIIGSDGPSLVQTWLAAQLAPLATLGLPRIFNYVEDFLIRSIPFPAWTVKSSYKKLYEGLSTAGTAILDEAGRVGIKRDEACHNLVFMLSFNAQGGLVNQFPILIKWLGLAGEGLHKQLAEEIRTVVKDEGGVSLRALDQMTLTKSVVYEVLRIEPAVPFQYAKAREDLVVESHDAAYEIKKGEMIFGYQPFATKDPKIFENAEDFVAHRFLGHDGEKLLRHVLWSNGPQTEEPTPDDKQCPAKNLVVLMCRLYLVEFFLRYDTFTFDFKPVVLGPDVTIKSLAKASSF